MKDWRKTIRNFQLQKLETPSTAEKWLLRSTIDLHTKIQAKPWKINSTQNYLLRFKQIFRQRRSIAYYERMSSRDTLTKLPRRSKQKMVNSSIAARNSWNFVNICIVLENSAQNVSDTLITMSSFLKRKHLFAISWKHSLPRSTLVTSRIDLRWSW